MATKTYKKGETFTDPAGRSGTVAFDNVTGKPLKDGQTVQLETAVQPIVPTVGLSDSTKKAGEFGMNSNNLDKKTAAIVPPTVSSESGASGAPKQPTREAGTYSNKDGQNLDVVKAKEQASLEKAAKEQKKRAENLLKTTLAANDSLFAATSAQVNSSYNQLIDQRKKLDEQNISRAKAYGMGNGAQYTPGEFTNGISLKVQEAQDNIFRLDMQRNAALMAAQANRDAGNAAALKGNMDELSRIERQMKDDMVRMNDQIQKEYKLALDIETEQKTAYKEWLQKVVARLSDDEMDKYMNAKTPEEKNAIVQGILSRSGADGDQDAYYAVRNSLNTKISDKEDAATKKEKDKLSIEKAKLDIQDTRAGIAKKYADIKETGSKVTISNIKKELTNEGDNAPLDKNGYLTPAAWEYLNKQSGASRDTLLKEFSSYLYVGEGDEPVNPYRLTKKELSALRNEE